MLRSLDDFTHAGGVAASLQRGAKIRTDVEDPDQSGPIYLDPGDEECTACEALITGYHGADYGNLLGRLKRKYGCTVCPACLDEIRLNGSGTP